MLGCTCEVRRVCLLLGTFSLLGCGLTLDTATPTEAGAPDGGVVDGGVVDGGALDGTVPIDTGTPDADPPECLSNTDCDDGEFCNGFELCAGGRCVDGGEPSCDDGVECTEDSCEGEGCLNDPKDGMCREALVCSPFDGCIVPDECEDDGECDDGLFCNGTERCAGGFCEFGVVPVCPSVGCLVGHCSADEDRCVSPPDDGVCDDGVGCTEDFCGSDGRCSVTPIDAACDDGVHCTLDVCRLDGCGAVPVNSSCDDGVGCTEDRCSPASTYADGDGCVGVPNDPFCTTVGGPTLQCAVRVCVSGAATDVGGSTGCALDYDSALCDGADLCTAEGACEPALTSCGSDLACNDGNPCNGIERCATVAGGGGRCVKASTSCPETGDPCVESYCVIESTSGATSCGERPLTDCVSVTLPGGP